MRAKTLQVVWHSKEPVFSVDFHPDGTLATGGADKDIKLWELSRADDGCPQVRYLSSLSGHSKSVNCVRFSPSGDCLASAGDSGEVLLWRPAPGATRSALEPEGEGPVWRQAATLRGNTNDVQDIAWSPDASALLSGGVENECMVFDVDARKMAVRLANHKHYVQGVAWDPLGRFLVSQSVDRTAKVYAPKPPAAGKRHSQQPSAATLARDMVLHATLAKRNLPDSKTADAAGAAAAAAAATDTADDAAHGSHGQARSCAGGAAGGSAEAGDPAAGAAAAAMAAAKAVQQSLFHDEALPTFFRRLAFSPDGSLLVVPAGMYKRDADSATINTTYIFARGDWSAPVLHLPNPTKHGAAVVVRFCPLFFRPGQQQEAGPYRLPYRLVFAVATVDSVLLYDTESLEPFAILGALHYAPITDLAWSCDGCFLAIASHDGYCSAAAFAPGELGEPLPAEQLPPGLAAALAQARQAVGGAAGAAAATAAAAPGAGGSTGAGLAVKSDAAEGAEAGTPKGNARGNSAAALAPPAAALPPAPDMAAAVTNAPLPAAGHAASAQQQQQQQQQGPRHIQPQPVPPPSSGSSCAPSQQGSDAAGDSARQPLRTIPAPAKGRAAASAVGPSAPAATAGVAATGQADRAAAAGERRRISPTPVHAPSTASPAGAHTQRPLQQPPPAGDAAGHSGTPQAGPKSTGAAAAPAATPVRRRITPQPVGAAAADTTPTASPQQQGKQQHEQQQQEQQGWQEGGSTGAGAESAGAPGRPPRAAAQRCSGGSTSVAKMAVLAFKQAQAARAAATAVGVAGAGAGGGVGGGGAGGAATGRGASVKRTLGEGSSDGASNGSDGSRKRQQVSGSL